MRLPKPRGGLSEWLVSRLSSPDATGASGAFMVDCGDSLFLSRE